MNKLKTLPLFENTSESELMEIQKAAATPLPLSLSRQIKAGEWQELVKQSLDLKDVHTSLLATYAMGKIDDKELSTAFIFIECAQLAKEQGKSWSIHALDPANPYDQEIISKLGCNSEYIKQLPHNLRFEICLEMPYLDTLFSFNDKDHLYHMPSLGILQASLDSRFGYNSHTLFPIFGLSKRENMSQRIREYKSDFALTRPDQRDKTHGAVIKGPNFFIHDAAHAGIRSTIPKEDWAPLIDLSDRFEVEVQKLPAYQTPCDQDFHIPWIKQDATEEDQIRWLMESFGGFFMEGAKGSVEYIDCLRNNQFKPLNYDQMKNLLQLVIKEELGYIYAHRNKETSTNHLDPQNIPDYVIAKCASLMC